MQICIRLEILKTDDVDVVFELIEFAIAEGENGHGTDGEDGTMRSQFRIPNFELKSRITD